MRSLSHLAAALFSTGLFAAGLLAAGPLAAAGDATPASVESLLREGRYAEAVEVARADLDAAETAHGKEAPATADVIDRLVDVLWRTGRSMEPATRTLAERALAIRRAGPGGDEAGLASSLTNLGILQATAAEFRGAQETLEQALALRVKTAGPDASIVAVVKDRLAAALANSGNAGRARQLLEESVATLGRDPDANAADLAASLTTLGGLVANRGDLVGSRAALSKALDLRTRMFGPDHPETAATLFRQAYVKRREADVQGALELVRRVLAIRVAKLAPDSPEIASTLGLSAELRFDRGDVPGARADAERAFAMRRAAFGPTHPLVATSLSSLAGILEAAGDYAGARPLFEQSLEMQRATLGLNHPQVALTLNSLGEVLAGIGDLPAALADHEQALEIAERSLPPDHPQRTLIVADLADVLARSGREEEGRKRLENARATFARVLGENHPQVGDVLVYLAESYERTGDYERGAEAAQRAQSILMASFGPDSLRVGRVVKLLGTIRREQGKYGESGEMLEHASAIFEAALGPDHRLVGETLVELSLTRWLEGSPGQALAGSLHASRIRRDQLHNASGYLSEREALGYRSLGASTLDLALSCIAARAGDASAAASDVESVWDEVVRTRAQVLDEVASRHRLALESGRPQARTLIADLDEARTRLSRLAVAAYGTGKVELHPGDLDRARRDKEAAERALAAWSAVYRESELLRDAGSQQVRADLPPKAVLVSFVRYGRYATAENDSTSGPGARPGGSAPVPSYIALVIRPAADAIDVVPIGDAANVDAMVGDWRKEASTPPASAEDASRYRAAADRLARLVWRPIAAKLGAADLVLIVPDGALQFVGWDALPAASGKYLGEGRARIHLLSAERDVVHAAEAPPPGHGLLAVGGPDFDAAPAPEGTAGATAAGSGAETHGGPTLHAPPSPCDAPAPRFAALPSAAAEAADVGRLWEKRTSRSRDQDEKPEILTGDRASEDAFRAAASGRRIVHVATHGYFLKASCHDLRPDDALLRAGLALAGANRAWGAMRLDGASDGLLSGEEIASIDLRGVEWVVLSTCGSSLGSVEAGEGVLGLRRAFEVAGARTLITSLWSLDDQTARRWIDALYDARLRGVSTAGAVREAGLEILRARRRDGLDDHPYYWAPFVAAGDWR